MTHGFIIETTLQIVALFVNHKLQSIIPLSYRATKADFADCCNAKLKGEGTVISYDRHFDKLTGIEEQNRDRYCGEQLNFALYREIK